MPIGGVAAYRNKASVVGVDYTPAQMNALADEIQRTVAFGVGRNNVDDDAPVDHPLFDSLAWDLLGKSVRASLWQKARTLPPPTPAKRGLSADRWATTR